MHGTINMIANRLVTVSECSLSEKAVGFLQMQVQFLPFRLALLPVHSERVYCRDAGANQYAG